MLLRQRCAVEVVKISCLFDEPEQWFACRDADGCALLKSTVGGIGRAVHTSSDALADSIFHSKAALNAHPPTSYTTPSTPDWPR